jgi:hypothetical protein
MKKYNVLLFLLLSIAFNSFAQNGIKEVKQNPKLTIADRKNYILSIDVKRIKYYDSIAHGPSFSSDPQLYHFCKVPVTLTNSSSTKLEYMSMSCGWDEIYLADNKDIKFESTVCEYNIPVILMLASGQSKTVWLSIYRTQKSIKFRAGMTLRKDQKTYFPFQTTRKDKQDVIWSNPIIIPAN